MLFKDERKKPSPKGLYNFYKFVVFGTASDIARSILYKLGIIKGALSGLRQFLVNESPLEMMKDAFYFTLKALFVLKIFKFLSFFIIFGHVEKHLQLFTKYLRLTLVFM